MLFLRHVQWECSTLVSCNSSISQLWAPETVTLTVPQLFSAWHHAVSLYACLLLSWAIGPRSGTFMQISGTLFLCHSLNSSSMPHEFQLPWPFWTLIFVLYLEFFFLNCSSESISRKKAKMLLGSSHQILLGVTTLYCLLSNIWKLFLSFLFVYTGR